MDWKEVNSLMADRSRRRREAIADCVAAHADDEFSEFAPTYADFVDMALAPEAEIIPWLVEYVERFTHDCPDDREQLKRNLSAIHAAL